MKITTYLNSFLALSWLAIAAPAADTYTIDTAHSTVGFSVNHMVINTVHGKFKDFTGTITVEDKEVKAAKGTVQAKTIDTANDRRDNHLRTADFFDVAQYPTITFESKRAEKQGGQTVLVGDFTMHGVTKELTLPVTLKGPIKDPWGNNRIGLEAKAKINRKEYGLKYSQALETGGLVVGDEVELEINAEGTMKASK